MRRTLAAACLLLCLAGEAAASTALIAEARRHLGTNPTAMPRLWCARFLNMVLERTGHRGTKSDKAFSFLRYGARIKRPQVGAIAILTRRGGGHVGIVTAILAGGDLMIVSGNHNRIVAEAKYPRKRAIGFVLPPGLTDARSGQARRAPAPAAFIHREREP